MREPPSERLPPHHLVHHACVGLDDLHDLGGHFLRVVVRDGGLGMGALPLERDGGADRVEQPTLVDARQHEAAPVHRLRALGRGPDADRGERAADRSEVARLLGERARVGDDGEGVNLEAVVVMEAHGLVRAHQGMQPEARLLQALARAGVAAVQDGPPVFLGEGVDCTEERAEARVVVHVLLAVGGE